MRGFEIFGPEAEVSNTKDSPRKQLLVGPGRQYVLHNTLFLTTPTGNIPNNEEYISPFTSGMLGGWR